MNDYRGPEDNSYSGGFKWPGEHGWGGEIYNFAPANGRCYGHVEVLDRSIRLEKLGANKDDDWLDGVLAVWTAPNPWRRGRTIVGWYRHARIYRWCQFPSSRLAAARTYDGNVCTYQVEADENDCRLLQIEERVLTIPPREQGQTGLPGKWPVYYPSQQTEPQARRIEQRIREFIATGRAEPLGSRPHRSGLPRTQDPERRKEIENAAVTLVSDHFTGLGYTVENRSTENLGWDLEAAKGDELLCIEVKGRSGTGISADFTVKEYEKIKLEERCKFEDGSYRICIVIDALNEGSGAKLHHFICYRISPTEGEWRSVSGRYVLKFKKLLAARASSREDEEDEEQEDEEDGPCPSS